MAPPPLLLMVVVHCGVIAHLFMLTALATTQPVVCNAYCNVLTSKGRARVCVACSALPYLSGRGQLPEAGSAACQCNDAARLKTGSAI